MNASHKLSHTESHFAAGIIYQDEDGIRYYLVIEYNSGDGTQIKFPGGTNNDHPGEEMIATLKREMEEETGLVPERFQLVFSQNRPGHLKHFYLIPFDECHGTLRTEWKTDDGDKLSPPFWKTSDELQADVSLGGLFWSHREAMKLAKPYRNLK